MWRVVWDLFQESTGRMRVPPRLRTNRLRRRPPAQLKELSATGNEYWGARMLPVSAAIIVVFQSAYLLNELNSSGLNPGTGRDIIYSTSASPSLHSFRASMPGSARHWRGTMLAMSWGVIGGTAAINVLRHEDVPLFIVALLSATGTGRLVPWSERWQAALNVFAWRPLRRRSTDTGGRSIPLLPLAGNDERRHGRPVRGASHRALSPRPRRALRGADAERTANCRGRGQAAQNFRVDQRRDRDLQPGRRPHYRGQQRVQPGHWIYAAKKRSARATANYRCGEIKSSGRRFVRELKDNGILRNMEAQVLNRHGALAPFLLSGSTVELDGELCAIVMARDIATLKHTQNDLVAAREQALSALRAKSEFLSIMSHEIRTPMNAVLGMAEVLSETRLDRDQLRYLEVMRFNGGTLLILLDDILDLAKIESGRLQLEHTEFELGDLVEKTLETLAVRAHGKGLELIARIAPGTATRRWAIRSGSARC